MRRAAVAIAIALTCAACAEGPGSNDAASGPATTATASLANDWRFCDTFEQSLTPTADLMVEIASDPTGATIDAIEIGSTAALHRELVETAPSDVSSLVADYTEPVLTLASILAGEIDGEQTLDTQGYKDATLPLLTYCTETVGYPARGD